MKISTLIITSAVMTIYGCSSGEKKNFPEFSGEDISSKVEIFRDPQTKVALSEIKENTPWQFYVGPQDTAIDLSRVFMSENEYS